MRLLVATGRRVTSTRQPLARLGLAPPAVVLNGALAVDLATSACFHRHPFPVEDAESVLDAFLACGLEPCVYVEHDEVDVFVGSFPSTHPDHIVGLGVTVREGDLPRIGKDLPVLAFGIMGRPLQELSVAAAAVAQYAEGHLGRAIPFPDSALTVAPRGLSKWDGVLAYCRIHHVDPTKVLAIGDGPNDIELLSRAAVAVVSQASHVDALAHADHVIGSPDSGGWADILDHLS